MRAKAPATRSPALRNAGWTAAAAGLRQEGFLRVFVHGYGLSGRAGEGVVPAAIFGCLAAAAGTSLRLSGFWAGEIAGFVHSCAFRSELCRFRGGGGSSFDDEPGGFELDAGGSFGVAEDVAKGLVGEADQSDGPFVEHPIAVGEGLREGGFEMGKLAAPGKNVLAENVGNRDGAADGPPEQITSMTCCCSGVSSISVMRTSLRTIR
jgi:hypothetical protein